MNEKILIVEDEEDLRNVFAAFLEDEGYEVIAVENFNAAVKALNKNRIDLVYTDIMLGGKTGIDLLREIKEKDLPCPVVMITGAPSVDTASEAVAQSGSDMSIENERLFLTTPVIVEKS